MAMLRDAYLTEQVCKKHRATEMRRVLTESLDAGDIKRTRRAIEQIKSAAGPAWDKLPALQTGLTSAHEKLVAASRTITDDFGGFDSFKSRIVSKAGGKIAVALTDTFTFVTSILNGFKNFDDAAGAFVLTIKTDNGTRKISLSDMGDEFKQVPLTAIKQQVEDKLGRPGSITTNASAVASLLLKEFRPKGLLSIVKKLTGASSIPYIDEKALVEQLMSLSYSELVTVAQNANQIAPPITRDDMSALSVGVQQSQQPALTQQSNSFETRAAEIVKKLDPAKRKVLLQQLKDAVKQDVDRARANKTAKKASPPKP